MGGGATLSTAGFWTDILRRGVNCFSSTFDNCFTGIVGTATSVFFAYLSGRLLLNLFPFPLSKAKMIGEFCINRQSAGEIGSICSYVHYMHKHNGVLHGPLNHSSSVGNAQERKNPHNFIYFYYTLMHWHIGNPATLSVPGERCLEGVGFEREV